MLYFKINTFYFPIFIDLDYLEIEACGGTKALCTELPVETAVAFLKKIRRSGITHGLYKHTQLCDLVREYVIFIYITVVSIYSLLF